VDLLKSLVAIPSVNTMGQPVAGNEFGEARLTDYLADLLQQMGLTTRRYEVEPGRTNLLARLDGTVPATRGGQLVVFAVHQDTVPVVGMTIDPFVPKVQAGRLYGRGACDVKGGMAAMLAAVGRLAQQRPRGMPTVVLACTVNEECGFTGARNLAELCTRHDEIMPRRPDAAIVAEPTNLHVVVAHKGVVRWRCHARGVAGHSARPEAGENAIYRMANALLEIERYQWKVVGLLSAHPLCGHPTISVGTIHGGASVNTIPDQCTIEIDRRLCPQEKAEDARTHLVDYLATRLDFELEHDAPFMEGMALSDEANRELADHLASIVSRTVGSCDRMGVPYATDAAFLAAAGVPTVVFGPGSIEQAHTKDEWIDLDQLKQATEIYYQFASA
jgi:acetylornithine deacetylase